MQKIAFALIIVGALLAWAYYAPRLVATVRLERDRRTMRLSRPNRLERLAPGDPSTDEQFDRIAKGLMVTDPTWAAGVRVARWAAASKKPARQNGSLR